MRLAVPAASLRSNVPCREQGHGWPWVLRLCSGGRRDLRSPRELRTSGSLSAPGTFLWSAGRSVGDTAAPPHLRSHGPARPCRVRPAVCSQSECFGKHAPPPARWQDGGGPWVAASPAQPVVSLACAACRTPHQAPRPALHPCVAAPPPWALVSLPPPPGDCPCPPSPWSGTHGEQPWCWAASPTPPGLLPVNAAASVSAVCEGQSAHRRELHGEDGAS